MPFLSSRWQDFLLCLHSDWLSGLEKKDASMFEIVSNSFVISEINLQTELFEGIHLKINITLC